MLMALTTQAQQLWQAFRKPAATSSKNILVKPAQTKGVMKKLTPQEMKAAKAAGDKQQLGKSHAKAAKAAKTAKGTKTASTAHIPAKAASAPEPSPATVPYDADFFSSEEDMDDFAIINNNDDTSDGEPCTWKWSQGNGAYYIYNEDGETAADDYLVLPVMLEGGKTYEVTVTAASWNYQEEFEVVAGTECSAEGMSTVIIGNTTPENDPADYAGTFTPESDGLYYVAIHCTSAADQYILSVYHFNIDFAPDPAAPAAATGLSVEQVPGELRTTVTFTAPTTSIGGDQLTDNVSIDVQRDGQTVATLTDVAPGSERTCTDEVPAEGIYHYQVVTSNAAGKGRKSNTESVKVVMPQDIPYTVSFADGSAIDNFTVIDNNDDGSTWNSNYTEDAGMVASYQYDWDNAADDYLVSQPLRLQGGKHYEVTVRAAASSEDDPERLEVLAGMGVTTAALDISVIGPTDISSTHFIDVTGSFTAQESGIYYVAVHAISDPNSFYLYVSDLSVEQGAEATAPAAAVLTAEAAAEGTLAATIRVTAPTKCVDGTTLTAISKIELYRNNSLTAQQENVAPGEVVTFADEAIEASGLYSYHAVTYNESGNGEKSQKATVYVGLDQPAAPENVTADDHITSVTFSWDAVTKGMNGGYVDPAGITYDVWSLYMSPFYVLFDEKLASVKGETTVTADINTDEGDEQQYSYYAVRATNESTYDEDKAAWNYTTLFTGKPYDMPFTEKFTDDELHFFWETNGLIFISSYASDGDNAALALLTDTPGQIVFVSGKVNLHGTTDPKLLFSALSHNIGQMHILGDTDGKGEWQLLQTVTLSDEDYQNYQVALASLKNHGRYARIAFAAEYKTAATADEEGNLEDYGDFIFIDGIRMGDFRDHDLAANIIPPADVTAGNTAMMAIYVENVGLQAASNYTVTVKAGEKELHNKTYTEELPSFDNNIIGITMPTNIFDEAGEVTITATIDYAADQDTDNNTLSTTFNIVEPKATAPESLTAEVTGKGVELKWEAPLTVEEHYTEDFEHGTGGFTEIDANGDGFGWIPMDSDELVNHSGTCAMQSYSWIPGEDGGAVHPDEWLVTPLAILDGTFSFWAAAQDYEWTDEHFAVYVSTKGNKSIEDFEQVSEEFVTTAYTTEYTVDLSSYEGQTGYIAIRHFNSYDNFAMVVDDITFTKAPEVPVAYNVYADQQLVDNIAGDVTACTISSDELTDGEHTFAVTAVYDGERESRPATITISVATAISHTDMEGKPVDVFSIDGKLMRRQATTLEGLKGVYVVSPAEEGQQGKNAKTVIVK